ncbi:MAG: hypothetical protein AAF731_17735, partial [Bacteroidota bacterium]
KILLPFSKKSQQYLEQGYYLVELCCFGFLEGVIPLFCFDCSKVKHAGINLFYVDYGIIGFDLVWALLSLYAQKCITIILNRSKTPITIIHFQFVIVFLRPLLMWKKPIS